MKRLVIICVAAAFALAGVTGERDHAEHAHWSYKGKNGPVHWGQIDPKFRLCALGANQSPVNMNRFIEAELPNPKVRYTGNAKEVVNNGHTIKVSTIGKNEFTIDGIPFDLVQFHFHTPSENTINGKHFPMEAHLVHKSKDGEYLVVALMFQEGQPNLALSRILADLDPRPNHPKKLKEMFNPGDLFPKKVDYYRYEGSFTTPPCTEGVRWIVFKTPVEASKEQLEQMQKIMGHNNRPTQPLHARVILK